MIIDLIVQALVAVFTGFLALLPAWSFPSLASFGSTIGSAAAGVSGVFPVSTLGVCLGALFALQLVIWGFDLVVFLWRQIPFKST